MDFGLQLRRPRGSNAPGFGAYVGSWSHLGAKMASRGLQEDLGTDFGRYLEPFWSIFGPMLVDFHMMFGTILNDFSNIFNICFSALLDVWAYVGHVVLASPCCCWCIDT